MSYQSNLNFTGTLRLQCAFVSLLTLTLLTTTTGCRDPEGRQTISGVVTLNGEPLPVGQLSLRPVGTGPSAGGQINEGAFTVDKSKGPLPGRYAVKINSYQETGKMVPLIDNPNIKLPEKQQVIPSQFNDQTELIIEVTGDGHNHFELDLKTE